MSTLLNNNTVDGGRQQSIQAFFSSERVARRTSVLVIPAQGR